MVKKAGKNEVTNQEIMRVLRDMQGKIDAVDALMEIQSRQVSHIQSEMSGFGSRLKRFGTTIEKRVAAYEERMDEIEGAIRTVVEWGAMKADLNDLATKNDLDRLKDEIIEPIIKAVDRDAETVFDHGKRITIIERKLGIPAK